MFNDLLVTFHIKTTLQPNQSFLEYTRQSCKLITLFAVTYNTIRSNFKTVTERKFITVTVFIDCYRYHGKRVQSLP